MIYLSSLFIKEDFRCFKKGQSFDLKPITLLVGDQGCGKSTLLSGLNAQADWLEIELTEGCRRNGVQSFYFDTEKMNPLHRSMEYAKHGETQQLLNSHFESHGETLKKYTVDILPSAKNSILMIDEPESALSVRNQYELVEQIAAAAKRHCQIFVATHCLPLIESVEEVLSLEHGRWMKSRDFLETQGHAPIYIPSEQCENEAIAFTEKQMEVVGGLLSEDYKLGYKEGIEHYLGSKNQ